MAGDDEPGDASAQEPPPPGFTEREDEGTSRARQQAYVEIWRLHIEYATLVAQQKKDDNEARKPFLRWVSIAAVAQLACANIVFLVYAHFGVEWQIPAAAISAWLAATVAQVIAVLIVVANNLFPRRENERLPDTLVGSSGGSAEAPQLPVLPAPTVPVPVSPAGLAGAVTPPHAGEAGLADQGPPPPEAERT